MKKNYLLSSMLGAMLMAMPVSADVIGMQTAVAVGDKLSLALNENPHVVLTWGNGTTENLVFNGSEVEIIVKDSNFTLQSDMPFTSLYCPGCSLTELNLEKAPNLVSVVCPYNQLKALNVDENTRLIELNVESNLIEDIKFTKCVNLENLNVAKNELTKLSLSKLVDLKTLICSDNKLTSLSTSAQRNLETLWCQGNNLDRAIYFSPSAKPVQICAFDNVIPEFKKNNLQEVRELWVDNNKLNELDLSENIVLETLSASNNLLNLIQLNNDDEENLKAFYVDGNQLMFNSFPNVSSREDSLISYNISNQLPYEYAEYVNVNDTCNLFPLIRNNAWGKYTRAKVVWKKSGSDELLVKNKDYKETNTKFIFYEPFNRIYAEVTSKNYPNEILRIAGMQVVDPTGVENVVTESGVRVSGNSGMLQVETPVAVLVQIYNVSGALVVEQQVSAGSYSWNLPAGVYIVNGKKVVVNR